MQVDHASGGDRLFQFLNRDPLPQFGQCDVFGILEMPVLPLAVLANIDKDRLLRRDVLLDRLDAVGGVLRGRAADEIPSNATTLQTNRVMTSSLCDFPRRPRGGSPLKLIRQFVPGYTIPRLREQSSHDCCVRFRLRVPGLAEHPCGIDTPRGSPPELPQGSNNSSALKRKRDRPRSGTRFAILGELRVTFSARRGSKECRGNGWPAPSH